MGRHHQQDERASLGGPGADWAAPPVPSFPARGPQPATRRGRGRSGILLVCLLAVLLAAAGGIIYYARGSNSPQATATDGPGSSGRSTPGTVGGAAALPPCQQQAGILVPAADTAAWQSVVEAYAHDSGMSCQPYALSAAPAVGAAASAYADADALIPEDQLAAGLLPSGVTPVRADIVARTPIVLVTGGQVTDQTQLRAQAAKLSITVESPSSSMVSALGLNSLTTALSGHPLALTGPLGSPTPEDQQVVAVVDQMQVVPDADKTLFGALSPSAAVLTTEARAWQAAQDATDGRVVLYLDQGVDQLSIPLVQLRSSDTVSALYSFLGSDKGTAALAAAGLRPVNGAAPAVRGSFTPMGALPTALPVDPTQLAGSVTLFTMLTVPMTFLAALDMSGSMNDPMPGAPGGISKIDLVRSVAGGLLQTLPDASHTGIVKFHSDENNQSAISYPVPLDVGTAPGHKQALLNTLADTPVGGTPLYNAVVYAYQRALAGYTPGMANRLLILTDGDNRDADDTITLEQMGQQVKAMTDPNRPIQVIVAAFGQDADPQVVAEMAQVLHAGSLVAPDYASYPAAVQQLFTPAG